VPRNTKSYKAQIWSAAYHHHNSHDERRSAVVLRYERKR